MRRSKKAFTLIELLVVIAIIAILAAILFPVFDQAKQAAKKTACLSNVKQISLGVLMYAGDVDDVFPVASTITSAGVWSPWQFLVNPYEKSGIFSAPPATIGAEKMKAGTKTLATSQIHRESSQRSHLHACAGRVATACFGCTSEPS